ncbi:MAG: hypothetical protein QY331_02225 [Melioribacteraceae bacterium]|jgi:quercetin dioxygenase-like cupin family protein|nr:hypothetical protein [Melioribacteraceae bacterium]WKZ70070.1 MAG: hypothetical protein QY331_02225 [Melioribacteraceae bacterium]
MPKLKFTLLSLSIFLILIQINTAQEATSGFTIIEFSKNIEDEKELNIEHLFDGTRRKISHITMTNGKSLGDHTVKMPIVIFCTSGEGELAIDKNEKVKLNQGSMITIEANVTHDVIAKPSLSFLLIRFMKDETVDITE